LFVDPHGEEPLRGELYGLEYLEAHARQLAAASVSAPPGGPVRFLLQRFAHNGRLLTRAQRQIAEAARRQETLGPDAEWLLENFYIVEDALREVRHDLPRGYYLELPKLAEGPLTGYPRIYALALALLTHTDSALDEAHITRFVQAYQTITPLTIGELWAVPTMLRLGLLENLRRLAVQMLRDWDHRRQAEAWATNGAATAPCPGPVPCATDPFFVRLLQLLRDRGPEVASTIEWLEGHLAERGTNSGEVLRREHQRQAANQVSVGNCVTSLRLLSALDWSIFFERTSHVEAGLREDPAGVYSRQDFATRDRYRRAVEQLARGSGRAEVAVVRRVLELARREEQTRRQGDKETRRQGEAVEGERLRLRHVGYYLVDDGRPELEADLEYRPKLSERVVGALLCHPHTVYFGALATLTGLLLTGLLVSLSPCPLVSLSAALLVLLLPASELAVGLVNYLVTLVVPPRVLPKLDCKDGIPADCATFVVMPSMLLRPQSAAVLLERLEIHYLANPDPQLRFALLTDFADAPAEQMPEDEIYLQSALDGVRALNARYPLPPTPLPPGERGRGEGGGPARFFLFHRRRLWNPGQGCWMGWERKRGKLLEFNRLLRGARDTSFLAVSGDLGRLPRIRFVLTLDVDTRLPRESAQRLVGTLAHPLNQPRFDPEQGRVVEGYGVLQPRVSFHLLAATRSLFARIYAASAGIDPYATAVSDVYQDLFGAGSYTGKGIYDVDAFEAAAGRTFPENHILSHDLIESNYARCGLATDIELLDDFPARYHAYARREHRWVRGDWQLLPWLFRRAPRPTELTTETPRHREDELQRDREEEQQPSARIEGAAPGSSPSSSSSLCLGVSVVNPLPFLERWKLFDNLRRSLVPPALVVLLALGWTVLPGSPWLWTGVVLAVVALPLLLQLGGALWDLVRGRSWRGILRGFREEIPATAGQVVLALVFLADQARLMLDAVVRTLVRLYVTRRNLLEWETAATTERRLGDSFTHFGLCMWPASLLALVLGTAVLWLRPEALGAAGFVLGAWFVSPVVAYWVSRPRPAAELPLTAAERRELRRIARKTWGFFETFVGDQDHWLPPDNFQEDPKGQLAHRTSPTNIGMLLLSTLAAHDLGYLSLRSLLERLEKTFDTLDQLERHHGHFHNWYDTRTLRSLQPGYLSTVDSGNLLGSLVALKQGLREKSEEPVLGPALAEGLADTLGLVAETLRSVTPTSDDTPPEVFRAMAAVVQEVQHHLGQVPGDLPGWDEWLGRLEQQAALLPARVEALAEAVGEVPVELERWMRRFLEQVHDRRQELREVTPWLALLREPAAGAGPADPDKQALHRLLTTPASVADIASAMGERLAALGPPTSGPETAGSERATVVRQSTAAELLARLQGLADRAAALAAEMDFHFLYNEERNLFAVGFNLSLNRLDNAHYDLLASEACLTSFLAVARGEAPKRHWFQLGRSLTRAAGQTALLSWSGTMFEYLMPWLLLRPYRGTLLDEGCRAAVDRHIEYGRQNGVPWGMSESAYGALDPTLTYHYQAFGVPGLGLKRGLGRDLVVAPYATALAVAVRPREVLHNFRQLSAEGAEGRYGYYEALDYTRGRAPKGRALAVRTFMAHHQGMSLVALANAVLDAPMPRRFHAEPLVRAAEMLLQERLPRGAPLIEVHKEGEAMAESPRSSAQPMMSRRLSTAQTLAPRVHLLSNGEYSVMVTNAGSGFSTCRGLDVTRWREDRTRDAWGQFCYVRDLRSGLAWSAGYQPLGRPGDHYEVVYSTDKAEFRRLDAGIETHLEIAVSPEKRAEVRRVTLVNQTSRTHELELTSYAEVVLGPHGGDLAHPVFGKLFLETEWVPSEEALLCRRRPRAQDQKPVWAIHVMAVDGPTVGGPQYETDRARFLGRGRTPADPAALEPGAVLAGTTGPVLDPIFSLRRRVRLLPGASARVTFTTAVADTREEALALADHYHDPQAVTRAFELAWAHSQVELSHLHLSAEEAHLYQRLAAHLVYAGSLFRAPGPVLAANRQGQVDLWRLGISGDRPIVLVRVSEVDELLLVRQLLQAHTYWRLQGLEVDLVILNEHAVGYFEEMHEQLGSLVRASDAHTLVDKPGGVFLRKGAVLSADDKMLLQAAAHVVLSGERGTLASQVDHPERPAAVPGRLVPSARRDKETRRQGDKEIEPGPGAPSSLQFANGVGGFTPDGREYVIRLRPQPEAMSRRGSVSLSPGLRVSLSAALPPAPWINVVANPSFGFLISESGGGYTWAGNSQMNRLTPWHNDPVADPPGEAIYVRDEATGEVWTPTPLPCRSGAAVTVRHGQGYTVFEQRSRGLAQELLLFVPAGDPVKLLRLTVRNESSRPRSLSATYYAEWVLGTVRDQAPLRVVTELDPESGALLARNPFNQDFAGRVAFADVSLRPRTLTADRTEFLGRNGSPAAPAALERVELSGRVGPALDPCAALQVKWDLQPGEEKEVVFYLGQAAGLDEVRRLLRRYREPGQARAALEEVKGLWDRILGAVQVRTPNPGLDLLLNRWLPYQVLSCRVWARSAFYQSGGAYGFRDQLQDVMALVYGAPEEARAHILRAASRQFVEGDVQHWWHPPAGRGVRTRFSDDFLWLPFVTHHYVTTTGDTAILDEPVSFLRAPLLKPEQEEEYGLPEPSAETGTLYEHCVRALEHGLRFGAHGLPLMGTGDWNDGMNKVGAGGQGESVWVGWFLLTCLRQFAEVAQRRGERDRAGHYRAQAERLRVAIEEQGWDGRWYRRAYFDDGTPLGSQQNEECRIDSLVQSWAVLSGAADPERARQGMAAVDEQLVRRDDKLILLFTPPFDQGTLQPGYIKGYVPGIRENGGQYTHAAIWVVQATAQLGQGTQAVELFDLLNPIHHAAKAEDVGRYRVEPYVVAADVYSQPPHTGRGGWTWYTGSAGWLYRVGLEAILGFGLRGSRLVLNPCIARQWPGFEITYRYRSATYHITVDNPHGVECGVRSVTVDGQARPGAVVELADDGRRHEVRVVLG
jgi:cyclic beta-1,2-glucan synthetase